MEQPKTFLLAICMVRFFFALLFCFVLFCLLQNKSFMKERDKKARGVSEFTGVDY